MPWMMMASKNTEPKQNFARGSAKDAAIAGDHGGEVERFWLARVQARETRRTR